MKVSTDRLPDSQVVLEIEVEPERLEHSMDRAYRKLAQRTGVPGFRKGKAPRPMLERYLGRDVLLHEALDILVPEVYKQAIEEQEIDAIDVPSIELLQEEPPLIKATVPIRPVVELGDYRSLRLPRDPGQVPAEEVDAALDDLRHRYALQEPVDRPVQMGDIVRADVRAVTDGRQVYADDDAELHLRDGAVVLLPGFAEGLVGAQKNAPVEVTTTIPDDYPQPPLAGKSCIITATVREIKEEHLSELNDDFARDVGEGFPSLQALRERLESDISERRQAAAEEEYREKAVDALVATAQAIQFPPVLVDREVDRQLRDEARAVGGDVERYLQQTRQSLEERRQGLRPQAEERVRRSLALSQLAELEGIGLETQEVDAELERMAAAVGPQAEELRRLFTSPSGREAIERSLLTRKTLDRLVAIASPEEASENKEASVETVGGQA